MKIAIIGTGYVGLTTALSFSFLGHEVTCIDINPEKINQLKEGKTPFFEPHLDDLLNLVKSRMNFSTGYTAIQEAQVVFIAVGTPPLPNGSPDLSYVKSAAQSIGENLSQKHLTVVINKSTVPIGVGNWVEWIVKDAFEKKFNKKTNGYFAVASNPEFLKEGSAIADTFYADRIVVGTENPQAIEILEDLYKKLINQDFEPPVFSPRPANFKSIPFIKTDLTSAELIKYSANSFLALKISFINEISELAEKVGANINQVVQGIGSDKRIGFQFLNAGLGWGGSCFGKDTSALVSIGQEYGLPMQTIEIARTVNFRQRNRLVEKLLNELKILKGKNIALLGLAFKPHTDDVRDAPALEIAQKLIDRGAFIKAHDPVAIENAKKEMKLEHISFHQSIDDTLKSADAVVICTEWPQYKDLDWAKIKSSMNNPTIIDGRNLLNPKKMTELGFKYVGMGVPS